MLNTLQKGASFQFHKGTIKTFFVLRTLFIERQFQFHKGTIKTQRGLYLLLVCFDFNSIKVRLKHMEIEGNLKTLI